MVQMLSINICRLYSGHVQLKPMYAPVNNNPIWINGFIYKANVERDLAYTNWKQSRSSSSKFRQLRNEARALIVEAKNTY